MRNSSTGGSVWFLSTHSAEGGVLELWKNLQSGFTLSGLPAEVVAIYAGAETNRHLTVRYLMGGQARNWLTILKALYKLTVTIRKERPSTIFCAMPLANILAPLAVALSGGGTRVVVTHHVPMSSLRAASRQLDRIVSASKFVYRVVCVSKAVADTAPQDSSAYRAKTLVIHNALPPEVERIIQRLAARFQGRRSHGRIVVASGRLSPQKNIEALVQAAVFMPDVTIKIIGNGPDIDHLTRLAQRLRVTDRLQFVGFQPREAVIEMLAGSDVFVQPSLYEGHSLALIEAAKLGIPLVVSNVPSQLEAVTAPDGLVCASIIDPNDSAGLAAAILALLDSTDLYLASAERARLLGAECNFDGMLSSYRQLTQENRGLGALD